ncbi:MAG: hypothetical protein KatS3mg105_4122 [Gemmatales bacterium]|nr:MAG: hypothetical protein KatS3mg105_4122 [Gemmatales bacterium]
MRLGKKSRYCLLTAMVALALLLFGIEKGFSSRLPESLSEGSPPQPTKEVATTISKPQGQSGKSEHFWPWMQPLESDAQDSQGVNEGI